ncbi:MAG: stage II sporulation protein P [Clostridiales bacterium]|jgi:stage II sporulation protein P|nr:stage II sporulation protein P [Clostridiales bacterium]
MVKRRVHRVHRRRGLVLGLVVSILLLFVISFFNTLVSGENFAENGYSQILPLTAEDFLLPPPAEEATTIRIFGLNDVEFDFSTNYDDVQMVLDTLYPRALEVDLEDLRNPATLRNSMYIVDNRTLFLPEMFDVDQMIGRDLRINPEKIGGTAPVVLIFHTHTTEMFVDSDPSDKYTGIVGIGAYLTELLNARGIPTMHYTRRFDIVDGRSHIFGAYERQEPYIRQILADNPSIEIIIDIHRDGIEDPAPRLITYVNGERTARLMFVNGLSTRNVNGVAVPIAYLPNPNRACNLAFSFQMQMELNQSHPGLNRRIYLNAFRFSTHFLPKSLFVEVGDQRNTFGEAINAMYPLADALVNLLK